MKKLFLLLAMVGLVAISCEGGLDNEDNGGNTSTPKIELSRQTIEVDFEPNTYAVSVTSPYSWKAESDNEWIVVESKTGIAGTEELSFRVECNDEEKERKGTILLTNSAFDLATELYVTQKKFIPKFSIEPEALNFATEGGTQEVTITSNFEYEVSTDADWFTITETENGIVVSVSNYYEIKERSADIIISSEKYNISKTIKVTQNGLSEEEYAKRCCIFYTSSDGEVITPYKTDVFGANIVSNTYENGKGVITFDDEVTSIGDYVFENCSSLTSITIPDSVTEIGEGAFYKCTSLKSITIGNSVTSIGDYAFEDCRSLTSITIPNGVTSIGDSAFSYCDSLTSITIPDSVTKIGGSAFSHCSSLTSVTIGNSVTSIGSEVFDWCTSLTSVTIGNSVTEIGFRAFSTCFSLTSVTIPDSVTSIGNEAFAGCESLTSVYCKPTTPPAIHYDSGNFSSYFSSFPFNSDMTIYVPSDSYDLYTQYSSPADGYTAKQNWCMYKSYLKKYNF